MFHTLCKGNKTHFTLGNKTREISHNLFEVLHSSVTASVSFIFLLQLHFIFRRKNATTGEFEVSIYRSVQI